MPRNRTGAGRKLSDCVFSFAAPLASATMSKAYQSRRPPGQSSALSVVEGLPGAVGSVTSPAWRDSVALAQQPGMVPALARFASARRRQASRQTSPSMPTSAAPPRRRCEWQKPRPGGRSRRRRPLRRSCLGEAFIHVAAGARSLA